MGEQEVERRKHTAARLQALRRCLESLLRSPAKTPHRGEAQWPLTLDGSPKAPAEHCRLRRHDRREHAVAVPANQIEAVAGCCTGPGRVREDSASVTRGDRAVFPRRTGSHPRLDRTSTAAPRFESAGRHSVARGGESDDSRRTIATRPPWASRTASCHRSSASTAP
jgi:hypothetical protein